MTTPHPYSIAARLLVKGHRGLARQVMVLADEPVDPEKYRQEHGRCPAGYRFDGTKCVPSEDKPSEEKKPAEKPPEKKPGGKPPPVKASPEYKAKAKEALKKITEEPKTNPPEGHEPYSPDPNADNDGDGVADAARVGICGRCVAPPKPIPRLPNLTAAEREVEERFAKTFENDPEGVANEYLKQVRASKAPNVFATDDAKLLSPDYNPDPKNKDPAVIQANKDARGRNNVVTHQTANAIAKKAFLSALDELSKLPEDDPKRTILVTSGGCAAGKGYAIEKVDQTNSLAQTVGAVWDAAGEQNGTENPWVLEECTKRGLKPVFLFVDADPAVTWASEDRGVVERANGTGRMVDARVFADSYANGAKNFSGFHKANKDKAGFIFLSSRGPKPQVVPDFPEDALKMDSEKIYDMASRAIDDYPNELNPAVRRGAAVGRRIWGGPKVQEAV